MSSWYVMEPPAIAPGSMAALDRAVVVKDGFSWPALLIAPLWLIYRKMWWPLLFWLILIAALGAVLGALRVPDVIDGIVETLVAIGFAHEANMLRVWSMRRQGWSWVGVVSADNAENAMIRTIHGRSAMPVVPSAEPPKPVGPAPLWANGTPQAGTAGSGSEGAAGQPS